MSQTQRSKEKQIKTNYEQCLRTSDFSQVQIFMAKGCLEYSNIDDMGIVWRRYGKVQVEKPINWKRL